jgi:hypothetical protein
LSLQFSLGVLLLLHGVLVINHLRFQFLDRLICLFFLFALGLNLCIAESATFEVFIDSNSLNYSSGKNQD